MMLEGSCHCRRVRFSIESDTPHPFLHCYCSICRKTAGTGGYAINIRGFADSLQLEGREYVKTYRPHLGHDSKGNDRGYSEGLRHFCSECGTALWASDPRWSKWIYPHAGAIDTALPRPPERVHMMEASAALWVEVLRGVHDVHFEEYPEESIAAWHFRHGLVDELRE